MASELSHVWTSEKNALNSCGETEKPTASPRDFPLGHLYETLRTYHARPFALEDHLARLAAGGGALGWPRLPVGEIGEKCRCLADVRAPDESVLRVRVGPGGASGEGALRWDLFAGPLPPYLPACYERGVRALLSSRVRLNPGGHLPAVKLAGNPELSAAKEEATRAGAFESLLCNPSGELAEGASSNLFLVKGKHVVTPHLAAGILEGVTRSRILRLCAKAGLLTEERRVEPQELFSAEEVFLTATTKEVVPVVQIGDHVVGRGTPGMITDRLLGLYQEMALEETRGVR